MTVTNFILADFIKENKTEFFEKLHGISSRLGIPVDWFLGVFYIETNAAKNKFINHRARNPKTRATGLIQFMPATAASLGTTVDELMEMSNVEQLDYVEKYFMPYKNKIHRFLDCYLAVFFPAAIGKPLNTVLQSSKLSAETVARYNPIYDINKDGKITVGEIEQKIKSILPAGIEL